MRRKSGELNIFSMSALDLFASALGAFILIVLILLPYYQKQEPDVPPEPAPACPIPKPACPPIIEPLECPPITAPRDCPPTTIIFADNLLILELNWYEGGDIDLHVKTPDGTYNYSNPTIPGGPGRITYDNQDGGNREWPALEMWKSYNPTQGSYKICYMYYASGDGQISVDGRLDKPTGPITIPTRTLRRGQEFCPLEFEISADYTFTLINLE